MKLLCCVFSFTHRQCVWPWGVVFSTVQVQTSVSARGTWTPWRRLALSRYRHTNTHCRESLVEARRREGDLGLNLILGSLLSSKSVLCSTLHLLYIGVLTRFSLGEKCHSF